MVRRSRSRPGGRLPHEARSTFRRRRPSSVRARATPRIRPAVTDSPAGAVAPNAKAGRAGRASTLSVDAAYQVLSRAKVKSRPGGQGVHSIGKRGVPGTFARESGCGADALASNVGNDSLSLPRVDQLDVPGLSNASTRETIRFKAGEGHPPVANPDHHRIPKQGQHVGAVVFSAEAGAAHAAPQLSIMFFGERQHALVRGLGRDGSMPRQWPTAILIKLRDPN